MANDEIVDAVAEQMELPDDVLDRQQAGHPNVSEIAYRIAWAKTYLKRAGFISRSARGVWALTEKGKEVETIDGREVGRQLKRQFRRERRIDSARTGVDEAVDEAESTELGDEIEWQQKVLDAVLAMSPEGFERLSQRLLRESGFTQVSVTGRAGDGGIDGKGVLRLGGLINFQVVFQSKRYSGTVSAGTIRDFRGAMIGRADKGLVITTGTFSKDARAEAIRDGAPAIDLVNGQELAELLKRFDLGVTTAMVERVEVDSDWFRHV